MIAQMQAMAELFFGTGAKMVSVQTSMLFVFNLKLECRLLWGTISYVDAQWMIYHSLTPSDQHAINNPCVTPGNPPPGNSKGNYENSDNG
jgi:hypothetical protein